MNEEYKAGVSDRVLDLATEAVMTAMRRMFDRDASQSQVRELVRTTTVGRAIFLLKERLSVRRITPGAKLDNEAQMRLAISEIVAESRGVFDQGAGERSRYIEELISKEHKAATAAEDVRRKGARLLELYGRLENLGYAQRTFTRKAARLRAEQIARLHSVLFTDENRHVEAVRKLDLLYERYLTRALESSEI
jgi:hypothetical protein